MKILTKTLCGGAARALIILIGLMVSCNKDEPVLEKAELTVNPTELDFEETGTQKTLTLSNTGQQNLLWEISKPASWVTLSKSSGELEGSNQDQITVTIDRGKIDGKPDAEGIHTTTLSVTARAGAGSQLKAGAKEVSIKVKKGIVPEVRMDRRDLKETLDQISDGFAKGRIASGGNADITAYGHLWGKSEGLTLESGGSLVLGSNDKGARKDIKGDFATVFTREDFGFFKSDETYYILAYATNRHGTGYSEALPFSVPDRETLFRAPYVSVETPSGGWKQEENRNTITIRWEQGQVSPPYTIELFKEGEDAPVKVLDNNATTADSYTFTPTADLTEGSGYYLRVTGVSSDGTSAAVSGRSGSFSIYNPASFPEPPVPNQPNNPPAPSGGTVYTVSFETNGGSMADPVKVKVEEGKPVTAPSLPTREGYDFAGWYTDEALSNAYDFDMPITQDITLYAKWEVIWVEVKADNNRGWSGRSGHTSVLHDGEIYVMGGNEGSGSYRNDTWSSPDGVTWTQVKANNNTGWSGRWGHTSVVHEGKIWVLGGWVLGGIDGSRHNDVWSSPDGVNWTQEKADNDVGWSARAFHTSVVHDGKIWVLGGIDDEFDQVNDVWSSRDGVNWTQEKADDSSGWLARYGHTSVVHDGKIYVMGGNEGSGSYRNDTWSSPDGVNWTRVKANDDTGWSGRQIHTSVVHGGRIYVMGGESDVGNSYSRYNDVWSSPDGMNWTQEKADDNAGWSARPGHTSVVHDGNIYVMGGYDGSYRNDVWSWEPPQ